MHSALWVSKSGLSAQDTKIKTISNNLANVSTTGFKRDRAVFQDLLYQVNRQPGGQSSQNTELPSGLQIGTGVRMVATQKEFTQGNLEVTDQGLDMAINGRGFFQILMPDGSVNYTRDGRFQIDSTGQVVTAGGFPLEPAITVPESFQNVTIGTDGVVTAVDAQTGDSSEIGSIQLADFINPSGLEAMGSNLFRETVASSAPNQGEPGQNGLGPIIQGALESSNVNVVEEMVNMIETQRAYEMNSKVISTVDQMLQFIGQQL
ncbi:flagellar basal-body rod protein FlgG [Ketobacter sp. MCCC 1A13808]|uniref:flagellar basal-body rod protein FlgG n=1 Tax=Ketobacter sp. MCCC 1A13808 TaxID=2602738 RepID=UPI000F221741|nr:flagellar basal-body rod protein FlgG [Ketobacter sp. MCCC 1A13808]MVF12816.1 flagellar basal-body rod protein FlgG [Ketobacter sp. MCCC 1A13808]RLP54510.1 MAG: flagellar basal-body rod protein FlgG [Ketobacter sp.]